MHPFETLRTAISYPWNEGRTGTTLVGGGILTILSPLVIPGLLVAGYALRVVEAVLDDREEPPRFGDLWSLFVDGVKAAVVLVVYALVPLIVGIALVSLVAGALGFRLQGGVPSLTGGLAAGGLAFLVALLIGGLTLLVWYVTPAALVHLARTRRLRAAFEIDAVRDLAESDAYGAVWLLAVAVFAANAVVLLVLNSAGVGVILSGFVSFYAFMAMAFLFAHGAEAAGLEVDLEEPAPEEEAEDEPADEDEEE